MVNHVVEPPQFNYRNFNICPHCEWCGDEDPILSRLSEGIPMISRSDGKNFHLVLADRPLPYPVERGCGATKKVSVYFWYACGPGKSATKSTVVLLPGSPKKNAGLFRRIEFIADFLAENLLRSRTLAGFYDLEGNSFHELSY